MDAQYEFPDVANPWFEEFPELINENNLTTTITDADFVGIKTGDVNGSAQPNLLSGDDRTLNGRFDFEVDDISLRTGNTYTVAFRGNELMNVEGYQATLALAGIELVDIEYDLAGAGNFGLRFVEQGYLTTSWNQDFASAMQLTEEDILFSLVIQATEDVELHDAISISSRYTEAEAYQLGDLAGVGINFTPAFVNESVFELYHNVQNPFQEETMISFNLPEDARVVITINDVTGRVVKLIQGNYGAGYNMLNVTRKMMNGVTGVLTYTVTAGDYTATRKMIVLE